MNWLLQGSFGGLHVFSQGFKVLRAGSHHQFGGGFGGIINNKLGLVEAEVDQESVEHRMGSMGDLQQGLQVG